MSQQSFPPTPGCLVGTLRRWDPQTKKTENPLAIYSRQEIFVGRNEKKCQYVMNDPLVSNKHLCIYTVLFDQDNPEEIAPLVYVQDISMNGTEWNGYRMANAQRSFLLSDGDILRLSPKSYIQFREVDPLRGKSFSLLQKIEMKAFEEEYVITNRKLGTGAFGQVHMAYKKGTGEQLACKIVDLQSLRDSLVKRTKAKHSKAWAEKEYDSNGLRHLQRYISQKLQERFDVYDREATILEKLLHPNIIGLERVIKSSSTIYLFQELITAGDLFSYIQYKGGRLPDIEAAVIVRQITIAVKFLHDRNIVHRDIKPDNILMSSRADGSRVVLTDFGCARLVQPAFGRMSTMAGTLEFSAPEVLGGDQQGYTKAVDLWSLGCVAAILLTAEAPFDDVGSKYFATGPAQEKALGRLQAKLERHKVGERAKDFVLRLLVFDPAARMDVNQALEHSWFTNPCHKEEFEALYRRSIRDWKPRLPKKPSSVDLFREHLSNPFQKENCPSRILMDSQRVSESFRSEGSELGTGVPTACSQTLSDLNLPPHGNFSDAANESSRLLQNSSINISSKSSDVCSTESLVDLIPLPVADENRLRSPQTQSSGSLTSQQAYPQFTGYPGSYARGFMPPWWIKNQGGMKRPCDGSSGLEGQDYEEVSNVVTGKRHQPMYGGYFDRIE